MKRCVVLLLIISLTCSLFSCNVDHNNSGINGNHPNWNFYPEGYTAGFPSRINKNAPMVEYWWVETYDECLEAITLLLSHGSTFEKSAIFTYDGELFDTKYCFEITLENALTEPIKFGDNPFDRRAGGVKITSYAFFDEVTIEEINHNDVKNYSPESINSFLTMCETEPVLNEENVFYEWNKEKKCFTCMI